MKLFRKISIFFVIALVLCSVLSLNAFATEADTQQSDAQTTEAVSDTSSKLDMNMSGADMSMGERASYALQGTVTGMLMVFAVLALLAAIVSLSKVIFYDIPNKKAEKEKAARMAAQQTITEETQNIVEAPVSAPVTQATSDTELVAVITAAIAAMLQTEEYSNEFKSGFRVVSFKKVNTNGAWNKK